MDALRDINERDGITVITNLHTLDTARDYCERIIGMAAGRVVFDGTPDELTAEAVQEIYGSDSHGAGIDEAMTSTSIEPAGGARRAAPDPPVLRPPGRRRGLSAQRSTARVKGIRVDQNHPARPTTGERLMLKKTLLAAVALVVARRRRRTPKTSRNSASAFSAAKTKPTACATSSAWSTSCRPFSASKRSRCSRPPTMTASSRACSAARSTMPNSAPRLSPRSISPRPTPSSRS